MGCDQTTRACLLPMRGMMRVTVWCLVLSVFAALVVLAPSHVAASAGWDSDADADAPDTGDIDSDSPESGVPLDPVFGRPMLVRSHGRRLSPFVDVDADRLLPSEVASIQSAAAELRDALEAERRATPTPLQRSVQQQSAALQEAGLVDPVTRKAYPFDSEGFPVVAFPRDAVSTSVHRAMIADAVSEAKAADGQPNTDAGPAKPALDQLSVTEEALVAQLTNQLRPSAPAPKLTFIQIGDRANEEKEEPTANANDTATSTPTSEGPAFPTRTPNLIKLAGGTQPSPPVGVAKRVSLLERRRSERPGRPHSQRNVGRASARCVLIDASIHSRSGRNLRAANSSRAAG